MRQLTRDLAGWTHYWKDIETFEGGQRGRGSDSGSAQPAALPADVAANVIAKDQMLKTLQSQLDRTRANLAKANARTGFNANKNGGNQQNQQASSASAPANGGEGKKRARGNRKGGGGKSGRKVTAD